MDKQQANTVRNQHQSGNATASELAEAYQVSLPTIYRILRNETFFDANYQPSEREKVDPELVAALRNRGRAYADIGKALSPKRPWSATTVQRALREFLDE